MNDVCFLVPTYPMHFPYALGLLESFRKYELDKQADMVFVFTSEYERSGFLPCDNVVLPKSLRNHGREIINIKKFYGLMQLKGKYKYIIILDDDCQFINSARINDICNDYFSDRILYGSFLEGPNQTVINEIKCVLKKCSSYFKNCSNHNLVAYECTLWFNQLCIYKTEYLSDFFRETKIGKKLNKLTWFDFDYNIYMNYLILYHGFEIQSVGIAAENSATEIPSAYFYLNILSDEYRSMKCYAATEYMQRILPKDKVFITLHLDRRKNESLTKRKRMFYSIKMLIRACIKIKQKGVLK